MKSAMDKRLLDIICCPTTKLPLALLPADRRRELVPDEAAQDQLLRRLADDAVLVMAARMRGQGA